MKTCNRSSNIALNPTKLLAELFESLVQSQHESLLFAETVTKALNHFKIIKSALHINPGTNISRPRQTQARNVSDGINSDDDKHGAAPTIPALTRGACNPTQTWSEQLLTPQEAARKLAISRSTFYRLRHRLIANGLEFVVIGGLLKYRQSSLDRLIANAAEQRKPLA